MLDKIAERTEENTHGQTTQREQAESPTPTPTVDQEGAKPDIGFSDVPANITIEKSSAVEDPKRATKATDSPE